MPGKAEVEQAYTSSSGEEDVPGFDVLVDDVLVVGSGEHVENSVDDDQDLFGGERPGVSVDTVRECLAIEKLHDQEDRALLVDFIVDDPDRARMLDQVCQVGFTQEASLDLRAVERRVGIEHLHRHARADAVGRRIHGRRDA